MSHYFAISSVSVADKASRQYSSACLDLLIFDAMMINDASWVPLIGLRLTRETLRDSTAGSGWRPTAAAEGAVSPLLRGHCRHVSGTMGQENGA
jgi:hypothetical protein